MNPTNEPEWEEAFASLPASSAREREGLLRMLREALRPAEMIETVAAADSPDPGIVALSSDRLLFAHASGKLRRTVLCSSFARDELRGCRQEDGGLSVLRFMQPAMRFSNVVPHAAADELRQSLGPPPADRWLDIGKHPTTKSLVRELSSRVPKGDHVLAAAEATSGARGALAVTDSTLIWLNHVADGRVNAASWRRDSLQGARARDDELWIFRHEGPPPPYLSQL
jgi:hypothetical protein